jgi:hypothetical protein
MYIYAPQALKLEGPAAIVNKSAFQHQAYSMKSLPNELSHQFELMRRYLVPISHR